MKVLLISNIYPDDFNKFKGVFVKRSKETLEKFGGSVKVVSLRNVQGKVSKLISYLKFLREVKISAITVLTLSIFIMPTTL